MITFLTQKLPNGLTSIRAVTRSNDTIWAVSRGAVLREQLWEIQRIADALGGSVMRCPACRGDGIVLARNRNR